MNVSVKAPGSYVRKGRRFSGDSFQQVHFLEIQREQVLLDARHLISLVLTEKSSLTSLCLSKSQVPCCFESSWEDLRTFAGAPLWYWIDEIKNRAHEKQNFSFSPGAGEL
jgi:hypothetical protein